MEGTRIIEIAEAVGRENEALAAALRADCARAGCFAVNVMGSPGAGKTSLILALLEGLPPGSAAVLEADLESTVDADAVRARGFPAVQIRTGPFCHLDAAMTRAGLAALGVLPAQGPPRAASPYRIVFVENVGNLVCTAQTDPGCALDLALVSLPEGDDKARKYPPMFARASLVAVSKLDYRDFQPFDLEAFARDVRFLNPRSRVFPLSAATGRGVGEFRFAILALCDSFLRGPERRGLATPSL